MDSEVALRGLTKSLSCPFDDPGIGEFCLSISNHFCHGKPLLWNRKDHAYSAHRIICLLLVAVSLLSFCFGSEGFPRSNQPITQAILYSFCREEASIFSLLVDLFNAWMFVYPALVMMAKLVPAQQQPQFGQQLGLPNYVDFFLAVVGLVFFIGAGSNLFASRLTGQSCSGFDSTVAASITYFSMANRRWMTPIADLITPPTLFWVYLPFSALLGGRTSRIVSWLVAGTAGALLGDYHLENRDAWQVIRDIFSSRW